MIVVTKKTYLKEKKEGSVIQITLLEEEKYTLLHYWKYV